MGGVGTLLRDQRRHRHERVRPGTTCRESRSTSIRRICRSGLFRQFENGTWGTGVALLDGLDVG